MAHNTNSHDAPWAVWANSDVLVSWRNCLGVMEGLWNDERSKF